MEKDTKDSMFKTVQGSNSSKDQVVQEQYFVVCITSGFPDVRLHPQFNNNLKAQITEGKG